VANEIKSRHPSNEVLFVSIGNPLERSALSSAGYNLETITAGGVKRLGMWRKLQSMMKIPKGIVESIFIHRKYKPSFIVGVGGYSSGPVAFGGWLMGIPIVLHEQNFFPGITNRLLSRLSKKICVSFPGTEMPNPEKVVVTGNPVRDEILDILKNNGIEKEKGQPFTVLIIGGSQGAHSINMAIIDAIARIEKRDDYFFIHQTGESDQDKVRKAYEKTGIPCRVKAFFEDMAAQYLKADLMICRAGATTIAEVAAIGKAALFIPFPFAADNHQVLNARTLVDHGAAKMILEQDLDGGILSETIEYYAENRKELDTMADKAKQLGSPYAAKAIVDECYQYIRN
jgi:UDP-N-acetylglucosamine--N-acetylmuramyl-(pentapeptide) pyrophosphoryl-undecaprenol N-acetylglucosamine transferase